MLAGWLAGGAKRRRRRGGRAQNGRTGHLRRWAVNQSMMIRFEICQIITLVPMYAEIEKRERDGRMGGMGTLKDL